MIAELFFACLVLYFVFFICKRDPAPLFGVYSQKGKWFYLKKFVFYLIYRRRQKRRKDGRYLEETGHGYGHRTLQTLDEMEQIQPLTDNPHYMDAVYFCGMNKDGVSLVTRLGRRCGKKMEIWMLLNVPGIGYMQHPLHTHCLLHNVAGRRFEGGGLKIEMVEPKRRWKVSYNGLLRKGLVNTWTEEHREKAEYLHVRFSFIFESYTDIFNYDTDMDAWALSDAIALEPWTRDFFRRLKEHHQTHYEQFGELQGTLDVEGHPQQTVRLRGVRDHTYGVREWHSFHRYVVHYITTDLGNSIMVGVVSLPEKGMSCMTVGCVFKSNAHPGVSVSWAGIHLPTFGEHQNPPMNYEFNFKADGTLYHVTVASRTTSLLYQGDKWDSVIMERFCDATVNGRPATCLAEFHYRNDGADCPVHLQPELALLEEPQLTTEDKAQLVVSFQKKACQSSDLVGGKGASLAMLTSLGEEVKVPNGFCITLTAFRKQLEANPQLQVAVRKLEDIACAKLQGKLKTECESLMDEFTQSEVCDDVKSAISHIMTQLFGEEDSRLRFAVRSSAAGEDGEEMSAAGQMETILGVIGKEKIFAAVAKCWASQFSYQAVEYKRQHGQPITSLMGVVVQEMVHSQVSGVLFTRDPITGNPAVMMVNANYGLGESVVSGETQPDTIYLSRTWDDNVTIREKTIGGKNMAIKLADDGGTSTEYLDDTARSSCCLPDEKILELGRLGIMLEKHYGDARDIEWAIHEDTIYLLQARPITSFEAESEEALIHEFDSPLCSDKEWITTANIGEMMPGAMTPLSLGVFSRGVQWSIYTNTNYFGRGTSFFNRQSVQESCLSMKAMPSHCNNVFLNLYVLCNATHYHILGLKLEGFQLAIMGKTLEFDLEELSEFVGMSPWWKRLNNLIQVNYLRYHSKSKTEGWAKLVKTYTIDGGNALDFYSDIDSKLFDIYKCWVETVLNTSNSGIWGMVLINILSQGNSVWTPENISDVAMLLSKCENVYSADVPTAMKELASVIAKSPEKEEFLNMTPQEAVDWIKSEESGEAGKKFEEFIARHGHRCVREAEFRETSWRAEPTKLIPSIQMIIRASNNHGITEVNHQVLDVDEAISRLKSPVTWVGRKLLRLVVPRARRAVANREWGKSISIEFNNIFKEAYWRLAKLMVEEGYLPDQDLLFFLTHYEIGQVLKTRSAKLVARAAKRRRIYPKQMDLQFPQISLGHPQIIKEDEDVEEATSVQVKGMPVSHGVVKGYARVVKTLKEAETIKSGEILIVPYTDVGWTPYFPLISGLVTEMGGLLSHGAVVAREYGLPCIVNCPRSTTLFKSGDRVILKATEGVLEKIKVDTDEVNGPQQ